MDTTNIREVTTQEPLDTSQYVLMTEIQHQTEFKRIDNAIEEYSSAMTRLLRNCGSNRNFGEDQMREFQKLFRARRRLIIRLERILRGRVAPPYRDHGFPSGVSAKP